MPRRCPTPEPPPQELAESVRAHRLHAALETRPPVKVARPAEPAAEPSPAERVSHGSRRAGPKPVPHINQQRPDGASAEYFDLGFCGPTCMAMIARACGLGSAFSDAELVERLSRIAGAEKGGGTDRVGLYRMARHLQLQSLDWNGEATFWMAKQLELGRYVIAAGNPFALPPFRKVDRYGRHLIVVDGLDDDGNFLMNNPWPDGVHVVPPQRMWQFLMTHPHPYQYAFWR